MAISAVRPLPLGAGQSSVWAPGAGVQGGPRRVTGIAAGREGVSHPHRAQPRPSPRGTPLEVLRHLQLSWEGPGADSAGAGEWTSPPPAGTGAPHAHITGH